MIKTRVVLLLILILMLSACTAPDITETIVPLPNDEGESTEFSEIVSEYVYPHYVAIPEPPSIPPAPSIPPDRIEASSKPEKIWNVPRYPFEQMNEKGSENLPGITGTEVPYSLAAVHDVDSQIDFWRGYSFLISCVKDMGALCRDYATKKYTHEYDEKFFEEKAVLFVPLLNRYGSNVESTKIYSIVKNGDEICVNFITRHPFFPNNSSRSRGYEITVNKADIKGIKKYRYNNIWVNEASQPTSK
jgi:hypothetical protein